MPRLVLAAMYVIGRFEESNMKLTTAQVVLLALKGLAWLGDNAFISVVTEICVLSKVRLLIFFSIKT